MDYNTLVGAETLLGSVKYWINYSRIDSAAIVSEAQGWIYQRLRVAEMRAIAAVPIALNDTTLALPTGYLDPIHFGIPGQIQTIILTDPDRFNQELGWDNNQVLPVAPPTRWCNLNSAIQLNSKSDAAYTGRMTYFKTPTALGIGNTTNFLTTKHETLMRRVCTMFAAEARKEWDTVNANEVKALELIETAKVQGDLEFRGMEMDFNWEAND